MTALLLIVFVRLSTGNKGMTTRRGSPVSCPPQKRCPPCHVLMVPMKKEHLKTHRAHRKTPHVSEFSDYDIGSRPKKSKKTFWIVLIFGGLVLVGLFLLWGFTTKWKFFCRSGGTPSPPGPPPVYDGISMPKSVSSSEKQAVKDYVMGNYPLLQKKNYHEDFWKSLDFFWNTTCFDISGTPPGGRGLAYIPDPQQTQKGNAVFRYMIKQFDDAGGPVKWVNFTPKLSYISPDTKNAGFTYSVNDSATKTGTKTIDVFDIYMYPLCTWHTTPQNIAKVNGVVVNRYPPGHKRVQAISYALKDTANKVIKKEVIPGVDQIHLNEGFKSHSMIEIAHCDTHMQTFPKSLKCITSCDLLASQCPGHPSPAIGFGKWVYYSRGTGIWTNLGKTTVFRNKIDSIIGSINLWDGKDQRDNSYVNSKYTGSLKGMFADRSNLKTWQKFVADPDGNVKLALETILTGACMKDHKQPSTAKVEMLDGNQQACGDDDPLGIGSTSEYSGPCKASAKYCDGSASENQIPLWWFWGPGFQGDWGALSPMVPKQFTEMSDKCAWLLWACVNGYDFAGNPNKYTWGDAFTNKYLKSNQTDNSIILNTWLANMGNSGYSTDDVMIGFANYTRMDSIQLTTSGIVGNTIAFEILLFTGSIDPKHENKSGWVCDSVNQKANMECHGSSGEPSKWLGGTQSMFFNLDPTDPNTKMTCQIVENQCDDSKGYYMSCRNDDLAINYADAGYAYPMSVGLPKDFISSCTTPTPGKYCPANATDASGNWVETCTGATLTEGDSFCILSASCRDRDNVPHQSSTKFNQTNWIQNINGELSCQKSQSDNSPCF